MLDRFDLVRITLSDGSQKEGYLVDITGNNGSLASMGSNTAFYLPTTIIELLRAGSAPAMMLPAQKAPSSKPYRVAALVGTHNACEDYFYQEQDARRYALAIESQWTNNTPDRKFYQFTSILVLTTDAYKPDGHQNTEQGAAIHGGVCISCERNVTALSLAGLCQGCVMEAMIDG